MSKMAFVLFSGTADKLQAAATLISGAAAMEMETEVFLQFWALDAFRKDKIDKPLPITAGYGDDGDRLAASMAEKGAPPWHEVLRMAKELGDVHIHACSLTMDLYDIAEDDLDPLVDGVIGVAKFTQLAEGGSTTFI